jgi:uncharacterized protein involved in exopolysaccharide biosynthesis
MSLQEIFVVIFRNWKRIFGFTIIGMILFAAIAYSVLPLTYTAPITILPPESDSDAKLNTLLQTSDIADVLTSSGRVNSQLYAQILQSRSVMQIVIERCNLKEFFQETEIQKIVNDMKEDLQVAVQKEGIIEIRFPVSTGIFGRFSDSRDSIKQLAANISNTFAEALHEINIEKLSSKAKKARLYIEHQLEKTKARLDSAEYQLAVFQKDEKVISLPEQIQAAFQSASELKSEITKTEIELGYLSQFLSENNQRILSVKQKLKELRHQFSQVESQNRDYMLSFSAAPELAMKLTNLTREVKILNEVYLLLQQQYYREIIQENRNLPTIQVLDQAIPPLRHNAPRVGYLTALAGIGLFLILSFIAVASEKNLLQYLKGYNR